MNALNKLILFTQRQTFYLRKGGFRVFWSKVQKILTFLYMEAFTPVAVYLKIDWLDAYDFKACKLIKKIARFREQKNVNEAVIECMEKKVVSYLEKYIARKPDVSIILKWIEANKKIYDIFWNKGELSKCHDICQKVAKVKHDLEKVHQLDKLDIEFIPGSYAVGSIGVLENIEVYIKAGFLGMRESKKLILILDPNSSFNNVCYMKYLSKYITVINDFSLIQFISPLSKCLTTPIAFFMPFYEKTWISYVALGIVRKKWDEENRPSILELSNEDFLRGWKCLELLGVPKDAWFVCLHVREDGWHNDKTSADAPRNADIITYMSAIQAIVDAGGWVIRMGDDSMTSLPTMPQVIDYAHSAEKSDWMDIFLCAKCRFIVGTSSGVYTIALAFGVPAVMTNYLPAYGMYCLTRKSLFLPKLCWDKVKNRYLSFREFVSPPLGILTPKNSYDKQGIEVIDNTKEDIRDVVIEMLDRFNGTLEYSKEDEVLQDNFKGIASECGELYGGDEVAVSARIGKDFLHKHKELLSEEIKEKVNLENKYNYKL